MSFQSQPPKSSGNGKTTLEKGGRDPPKFSLDYIVKDLLSYFNEIKELRDAKMEAEKKYGIKKEYDDCWPEDDIRRAWGKTQKLKKKDLFKTRHWTLVIMMQIIERQRKGLFDMTEVGHLVQRCGELSLNNTPDRMKAERENGRREDDRRSTVDMSQACGKAQRIKVIPEDRSSQSKAELETVGAAGGVKQCSGGKHTTNSHRVQPYSLSQGQAGTQFPGRSQTTRNYFDRLYTGDRPGVALKNDKRKNLRETIYIRIPFSRMFNNATMQEGRWKPVSSPYKLIDRLPSENDIIIRKSHAISFNDETKNAEWVYEILNIDSVIDNCEQNKFEGYDRGHLAAAANHTWCWQAFSETYLNSNIVPQNHLLNIGPWKTLENRCRELRVKQWINNVHVYSGPLYINDGSGQTDYGRKEGKLVPTYLFKVIIVENSDGTVLKPKCYKMPNKNPTHSDPEKYCVDIDDLQRDSGLIFIEHRPNVSAMDRNITVTCEGEDYEEIPFFVDKTVIISS